MTQTEIITYSRNWLAWKTGQEKNYPYFGYQNDEALLDAIEQTAKVEEFVGQAWKLETRRLSTLELVDLNKVLEIMLFS